MENLLELSASGLCSFSLAETKQKSVCVCVNARQQTVFVLGEELDPPEKMASAPGTRV